MEIDDRDLLSLIVQNIETLVLATDIDAATKMRLISYYVSKKYREFVQTGHIKEIEKAIEKQRLGLGITTRDEEAYGEELDRLGVLLQLKYKRLGEVDDLQEAIERAEEAVRITPSDHPNLARRLNNLGTNLESRYECTGQIADLERAIEKAEEAVNATPSDHPDMAAMLNNLGSKLESRYERTGQIADLERAIEKADEAVKATPSDHPDLAGRLNNLGNKLESRYERTGQIADLERAIEKAEEALNATPSDHPDMAGRLNNLGTKLESRYERTGQIADLEKAIEKAEEAVNATPSDHPDMAAMLNNLGSKLESRYERTGQIADLERAIEKADEAVKATPSDHPDLAGRLNNLGNKLESRYERTGQMADLERAIEKAEEAVKATPSDHPDLAVMLHNLGRKQMLALDSVQTDKALSSFLQSWYCHSGILSHRLRSAVTAVDILVPKKSWLEAADLAVKAINLLPLMNRRMLSRNDQQYILSMFTGLAAKACSLSLESGRPVEASVEILEQGRGAILGLIIDDRRDISYLHQSCPKEAEEYERLRGEVNTSLSDNPASGLGEQMWRRRTKAVQELEECIDRIRHVPGLERFLLGASAQEMQQQASAGPIVIVNVTDIRSDAIIINQDRLELVPLPAFLVETLRSWKRQQLTEFNLTDYGKKNKKYCAFLSWVWKACVQIVVGILYSSSKMSEGAEPTLRVWWIGVGEASGIPFHAAGDHSPGALDNTISHVVSSYTPTIKALEFSREKLGQFGCTAATSALEKEPQKLCVVTMARTPGEKELPGVVNELASIRTAVASTFAVNNLPVPTAADVKEQLQECRIFHFAGHGKASRVDPSQGCLVLQKHDESSAVPVPDLLSVDDITRLQLPHAQLAYLSACSTAENNATRLADEVIHLVSGFQVAGFPHVIGSMWPSEDEICADMAHLFYHKLCEVNHGVLVDGSVATALRSATLDIRRRYWREPLAWTQYVHFGG